MNNVSRFFRAAWKLLVGENIPVWLSLILMALGAYATYQLAPSINEKFQIQAAKREFLVDNMKSFADSTKDLIDVISKAINEKDQQKYNQQIADANRLIAKLQFSSVQLMYVIPEYSNSVVSFQKSVEDLQNRITLYRPQEYTGDILQELKLTSKKSLEIYSILMKKAGIGI
ncbi:hypothetical protein FV222_02265 [Methylobacterium sp. WL103]|uniref:hypothetical protein n=1 Tax=Methylobacterium sp. WL103 TaxID=2603891 RepID=UPI0011C7C981|nr:hypothetical protein [Methylobacterium sp. WL103]TXN07508.1 hypothetical protein FV222_02265 [Methylobacterium sp. WL103]